MKNKPKPNLRQRGYEDCRQDMKQDLMSVVNLLKGDVDKEKIINYIEGYLLK